MIYKPSPTKQVLDKPLPIGMYGIFLGYRFAPGGTWNGEYLVQDLSEFRGMDFSMDASGYSKVLAPHVTKGVSVPLPGIFFPLKKRYDRVNFTLVEDPGDGGGDEDFQFPDENGGVDASLREDASPLLSRKTLLGHGMHLTSVGVDTRSTSTVIVLYLGIAVLLVSDIFDKR